MKLRLNNIVHIVFLDHSQHSGHGLGPMEIQVFGKLTAITKKHLEISSWVTSDTAHAHNDECFSILRSTITKQKRLK